jgi:MSHA biogenesis protein MshM
MYRQRFGLTGEVIPRDAQGKSFFETPGYKKLKRRFHMLVKDPGIGLLTAEPGVGKTSAMRNLSSDLPRPDYKVVYICDTAVNSAQIYRQIAVENGITPAYRRYTLWRDLKERFLHMVDNENIHPVLILDEAHHLGDDFLCDFSGFLNFAMDSRNVLTVWLVGQTALRNSLRMKCHTALASRIVTQIQLEPLGDRELFMSFLDHGFKAAGATSTIMSDSAKELLFRASKGVPRKVSHILRECLVQAHEEGKSFIDDAIVENVLGEEEL